ncbi:MbtH family protein [Streptacidiphilus sp. P02-A3a]|uniref:MbtH family protein n=1 Tax=Streptacidiphilus sp. P02-A3a TaxID=2704468 RepID=UPI0015FA2439|nr:MbtH family protein [Streptacidiphilus sp. P02-A3a]QMU71638.1 MbtH family protein [Streptacidiphilus sp. P02-A3a]
MTDETEDLQTYLVVVNHEEQYSVWRADRELPNGWDSIGSPATRAECLARIEEQWTDMRPLSVR